MNVSHKIIILFLLAYSAYTDIKERYVMMVPIYMCFFISILGYFIPNKGEVIDLWGIIPGILLLIIGMVSKGSIGDGDVYIVMIVGLMMGLRNTLTVLLIGSVLSAIYCLFELVAKGKNKKDSIPYIPFILSGYLGMLIFV